MSKDASPRIQGVIVRAVRVPMHEPHRTASGEITESPLVLTDVVTDAGVCGHSMVFTYAAAALQPTAELIRNVGAMVVGDALAPLEIDAKLTRRFRLLGTQGLVQMALSAIDMAVWDALARTQAVPLVRLLGGAIKPVRPYGAVGYDGVAGSAKAAESWARRGFAGIKAKIGYPSVGEDVAVVRAMRKAAGDAMAIMVDYNQCLTPAEAVARLRVLDEEGLAWVEEPTLFHDHAGNARVARAAQTPIQGGENWWGCADMQHSLDAEASDFVMPDVMKIGGVTGWLRAAALAQAKALPMSNHLFPELSARLLCCTPTAHWLEYSDWWNAVLKASLAIENGMAVIDDAIGSGVEWDEDAVRKFSV
ncbi:MAG: enolase C-terminal domain-like protein [Caldimonas sp.]